MRVIHAETTVSYVPRYMLHGAIVEPDLRGYSDGWKMYVSGWVCPLYGDMRRGWLDAQYAEKCGRDVRWSKRDDKRSV
jgi:hypothetical protein